MRERVDARALIQLKEKVEQLNEQYIRAQANYETAVARLKEVGYDSIEEAEQALDQMHQDIHKGEAQLASDMDALLDKYPGLR